MANKIFKYIHFGSSEIGCKQCKQAQILFPLQAKKFKEYKCWYPQIQALHSKDFELPSGWLLNY